MALIGAGQLVTFALISRTHRWQFRLWPLDLVQLVAIAGFAALAFGSTLVVFAVGLLSQGLLIGFTFTASGFYSLHTAARGGRRIGIHETVLGSGNLVGPLAGGLAAAIITDFVQGIMTIVFSFILLPFALEAVGGMAGLRQAISDPQMFSLVAPAEIGFFYIAIIALNALIGIVTQPHTMGNCAAGRTESDGRFGYNVGSFIKRL